MTPILYASTETTFTSNGLGRLADCIECLVTEERNGGYECEFKYPISGKHYANITEGCYIACVHDDDGDIQPFKIYRRSAVIDGIVTFNARHLSYELSHVIVSPFTASDVQTALSGIGTNSINTNPFTFSTDKTTLANFSVETPASVRSIMGGVEGSLLDVYGGEWEFDKYNVYLRANRGTNSGVTIRYGKNLIDLNQTRDVGGLYNAIVPFWRQEVDGVDTLVTLPEHMVTAVGVTNPVPVVMDFTMEFDEQPTEAQLRTFTENYLAENEPWTPPETLTVDFVALWQTLDYKDVANLLKLRLCDTVSVYYPALGVTANNIKVIKVVYNVLAERYDKIELGQPQATFAQVLTNSIDKSIKSAQAADRGFFDDAINTATNLLSGADGGNVVIERYSDGKPKDILIMDTTDPLTATNILKISLNGIGFSIDGGHTYTTAWVMDGNNYGQFYADAITAGRLRAIKIQGPRDTTTQTSDPEDTQYPTFWDLVTGIIQSYGRKQVTSNINGTATSYNVTTKTRIDSGEFNVTGKKDGDTSETTFADLGILASVNYDSLNGIYVSDLPGVQTMVDRTFPRGELDLRGHKTAIPCGTGSSEDPDDNTLSEHAGKAFPFAKFSTERIDLGAFDNYARDDSTPISTESVARNSLTISAGWNDYKDSIIFTKRFNTLYSYDNPPELLKSYYNPEVNVRTAWEFAPYEEIEIEWLYVMGCLSSSKKIIYITIPLARPVSSGVVSVRIEGTIHARQGSTVLCADTSFDSDTTTGADFPADIVIAPDNGISFKLTHANNGSWSSGTAYAPVFCTLQYVTITAYDYDYYQTPNPEP